MTAVPDSPESTVHYADDRATVLRGDCLATLPTLPPNSVDAVICDPPYAYPGGFMFDASTERTWDRFSSPVQFQKWCESWATEAMRVLKPGGHIAAFGAPRTYHRLASGLEDAGAEIRESIAWITAQGMPKSMNVAKAMAKKGVDPEVVAEWAGWGTTLKPAMEPIVVARKPLDGNVINNVLAHGTGAINIDRSRVAPTGESRGRDGEATAETRYTERGATNFAATPGIRGGDPKGRFPSNVVLDELAAEALDEQSGILTSGAVSPDGFKGEYTAEIYGKYAHNMINPETVYADSGGASRFYPVFRYQGKAPSSERPRVDGLAHSTVKPLALIQWLIGLFVPVGGVVLDPFLGSGTTLEAALMDGFRVIGCEREPTYLPLIDFRLARVREHLAKQARATQQQSLFGDEL